MANPRRVLRLQQLILEAAASYIQRELQDPRIGLVSVTRVKLAPDLSTAVIGWSQMGSDEQRRTTERGLEDAAPAVQREVARVMQTRTTPRISFRYDDTLERSQALEEIFEKLREERAEESPADEDEAPPAE